jgi:type II secretory pathway pseudopilin PulG
MKILGSNLRTLRRRGFALLTVLALAGVLMLLAGAVGSEIVSTQTATKDRLSMSRARFAAYTGLQYAVRLVKLDQLPPPPEPGQPNDPPEEAYLVAMPSGEEVSFTLQVTDNREGGAPTARDGTPVPHGAIYCTAVGLDNGKQGITLHAMAGMLSANKPKLEYAAFADQNTAMLGESVAQSFVPNTPGSSNPDPSDPNALNSLNGLDALNTLSGTSAPLDPSGRPSVETVGAPGALGNLGTNSQLQLEPTAGVAGTVKRPPTPSNNVLTSIAATMAVDGFGGPTLEDLTSPRDIPRYTAPAAVPADLAQLSGGTLSAPPDTALQLDELNVPAGQTLTLMPGRYYVTGDVNIEGVLASAGNASEPVILFVKGNTTVGGNAKVNLPPGPTTALQMFFVDAGQESQRFTVSDQADFFGTVVGNRVEGEFSGQAQMFGGFLGRSFQASDEARVYYDETLQSTELSAAANWGLNSITEPKPEVVLKAYPLLEAKVALVKTGNATFTKPMVKGDIYSVGDSGDLIPASP